MCETTQKSGKIKKELTRAPDPRVEKLVQALKEAMEWNWLDEDGPPPKVVEMCASALAEYEKEARDNG